jgi:hypothetical protein
MSYVPPSDEAHCNRQLLCASMVTNVLLVACLQGIFCTHIGHTVVLCNITVAVSVLCTVIAISVGTMAVHRTVGAIHLLYALSVSTMLVYWWWEAETLFPVFSFRPNSTVLLRLSHQLQPLSQWDTDLQTESFDRRTDPSFREQADRTVTNPIRVHWFDLCKLAWLPVITSLYCCLSTIVPDALPTQAREYRWHKMLFLECVVGLRWWLEAMNTIDSNDKSTVDSVNIALLLVDLPVLCAIWRTSLCIERMSLLPHCLAWAGSFFYSVYWYQQYDIHHYEDIYRTVWYDGVWCIAMLWILGVVWSYHKCTPNTLSHPLFRWMNRIYGLCGLIWWGMYKHITYPQMCFYGYIPYYLFCGILLPSYVRSKQMCRLSMWFSNLFVVHLCIWVVLEENVHTRHLTEYTDMQTLMIVCCGLLGCLR